MAEMSLKEFVLAMKAAFGETTGWKVTGNDGRVFQNNYPKDDKDKERK